MKIPVELLAFWAVCIIGMIAHIRALMRSHREHRAVVTLTPDDEVGLIIAKQHIRNQLLRMLVSGSGILLGVISFFRPEIIFPWLSFIITWGIIGDYGMWSIASILEEIDDNKIRHIKVQEEQNVGVGN